MQPQQHQALHTRLHELAAETGRLKRRLPADTLAEWTCDQIAGHIEDCITILEPTAHELAHTTAPGDEQAVTEALRIVDQRSRQLRHTLGLEAA